MTPSETGSELLYSQSGHSLDAAYWQNRHRPDKEALFAESNSPREACLRFVNSLICSWRNKYLSDKVGGFGQCTAVYPIVSVALPNQNVSLGFMILTTHG